MNTIKALFLLGLVFIGTWNYKDVYVDQKHVSGIFNERFSTKVVLNKGGCVYTNLKPSEVYNLLKVKTDE